MPAGKVFLGLPAMSGVHLNYNNKLSYNNIFSPIDNGVQVDSKKIFNSLQNENMVSTQVNINLLHLGYTTPAGATLYLFANERIEADFLYPKSLIDFIVNGNAGLVGEKVKIGKTRLGVTHFREMGAGYQYYIDDMDLGIGFRLKYFQGFFNMSTPESMTASITTESENYQLDIEMQNAVLRTSGKTIYDGTNGDLGSHLVSNGNSGFGVDLGFHYDLTNSFTIAGSVNDIGFISWKEDIENYSLKDTSVFYAGIDLKGVTDIVQEFKDTLVDKFDSYTKDTEAYNTLLTPRMYLSGAYHLTSQSDVTGTVAARYIQGQLKMAYGLGINYKLGSYFVGSINAIKLPQQIPNLGAAIAFKGGPAQLYIAVDQAAYWSVPDAKAIDVRFGINFIFGKPPTKEKGDSANKSIFLGGEVDVRGKDGIYTIIEKQKRRKIDIENPSTSK